LDPGSGKNLFWIPDPGVKIVPDPGSATLTVSIALVLRRWAVLLYFNLAFVMFSAYVHFWSVLSKKKAGIAVQTSEALQFSVLHLKGLQIILYYYTDL
jgi:hypothetical protein